MKKIYTKKKTSVYTPLIETLSDADIPEDLMIFMEAYRNEVVLQLKNLQQGCPKSPQDIFYIKDCGFWKRTAQIHAMNIYRKYPNIDPNLQDTKVTLPEARGENPADPLILDLTKNSGRQVTVLIPRFEVQRIYGEEYASWVGQARIRFDVNVDPHNTILLNKYTFRSFSNSEARKDLIYQNDQGDFLYDYNPQVLKIYATIKYK